MKPLYTTTNFSLNNKQPSLCDVSSSVGTADLIFIRVPTDQLGHHFLSCPKSSTLNIYWPPWFSSKTELIGTKYFVYTYTCTTTYNFSFLDYHYLSPDTSTVFWQQFCILIYKIFIFPLLFSNYFTS